MKRLLKLVLSMALVLMMSTSMFIMAEPSSSNYIDFETLLEWSSNVVVIDLPYSFESKDMSTYYNVLSATAPIWVDHPNFFQ